MVLSFLQLFFSWPCVPWPFTTLMQYIFQTGIGNLANADVQKIPSHALYKAPFFTFSKSNDWKTQNTFIVALLEQAHFHCLSSSVSYVSKYVCDHHKFIHKLIQLLPAIQKIKWRLFNIERGEHGLCWKKVFQTIEKKLPSLAETQISLRRVQTGSPPREGIEVFVAIPRAKKNSGLGEDPLG